MDRQEAREGEGLKEGKPKKSKFQIKFTPEPGSGFWVDGLISGAAIGWGIHLSFFGEDPEWASFILALGLISGLYVTFNYHARS